MTIYHTNSDAVHQFSPMKNSTKTTTVHLKLTLGHLYSEAPSGHSINSGFNCTLSNLGDLHHGEQFLWPTCGIGYSWFSYRGGYELCPPPPNWAVFFEICCCCLLRLSIFWVFCSLLLLPIDCFWTHLLLSRWCHLVWFLLVYWDFSVLLCDYLVSVTFCQLEFTQSFFCGFASDFVFGESVSGFATFWFGHLNYDMGFASA